MQNLLPKTQKDRLKKETRARLLTLFFMAVFTASVFGSLILFSLEIFLKNRQSELSLSSTSLEDAVPGGLLELNKEAELTNDKAIALAPDSAISVTNIFNKISADKPDGILIKGFSYVSDNILAVTVTATADKRDDILEFVDRVRLRRGFSEVDVPVSNFAKDSDISFTMSLKIERGDSE